MKFAEPIWLLVGLVACALLIWTWLRYDRRQRLALGAFAASHLHAQLTASFSAARRNWKRGLFLASVALVFVALARPQAGFRWVETKRRGIEILFAVDTSKSMLTPDVKPDRLTRAKLAVDDFVSRLDGDGVGLIAFAGNAFLQCPITLDYSAFNESLAALDTNTIPRGGTDISSAIREAQAALQDRPGSNKILILLTDGEDLEGDAVATAKEAAQAGLKIYTVGVGTRNGDLIPLPAESGGGFVKDASGQYVKSHLDETMLQAIANATGGIYAPLGAQGQGLDTIYQKALAPLAKHDLASRQQRVYIERYQWFLTPALLLLLGSLLIGTRRRVKRAGSSTDRVPVPTLTRRRPMAQNVTAVLSLALLLPLIQARASISDADAAYHKGDFATAAREFAAAAQHHSQKDLLQFDAGTAAYKAGQYAQAAEDFQKALEDGRQSPDPKQLAAQEDAYYNLGNTLYRTGQKTEKANVQQTIQNWEQAVKSFDAALQLQGGDTDSKFNRDLVQRKLDALKKQQQQQQKQDQKQSQANNRQKNQSQQGGQGRQAQNQGAQGKNSSNEKTAQNGSGTSQQQPSPGQKAQQPSQANNGGAQNQGHAGQPKNPSQQANQNATAQNSGQQQPGSGSKPDQQQDQQANDGSQNGSQPSQPQNGPQPSPAGAGQGTSVAQNGGTPSQAGSAPGQRVPGQMTQQEAKQLLDSLRDEQRQMPGQIVRAASNNSSEQTLKDW